MAGTKEGARKAAQTTKLRHGQDFHAKAGSRSWQNAERSREVGFALLSEEKRKELGAIGGSKKKNKKASVDPETEEVSTGVSE